ncbi:hypothetical protein [Streptomyces erythrochromogenes]
MPPGFATTADAHEELLDGHGLRTRIQDRLGLLHTVSRSTTSERASAR